MDTPPLFLLLGVLALGYPEVTVRVLEVWAALVAYRLWRAW